MEPLGGAASVVAFVTLAFQSAKSISEFLTGIKDGPESVTRAIRAVAILQGTLEQLGLCQAVKEASPALTMKTQVEACSNDLALFASRLRQLQLLDTDGRSRKAWKRVKTLFDEKELDKMTTAVGTYSSTLNLWLDSSHSNLIYRTQEQVSTLCQNVSEVSASLQVGSDQLGSMDAKMDGIGIHLTTTDSRHDERWSAIQATLDQTKAAIDTAGAEHDIHLQAMVTTLSESQMKGNDQLNTINTKLNESQAKLSDEYQSLNSKCSLILEVIRSFGSLALGEKQEGVGSVLQGVQEQTNEARRRHPTYIDRPQVPEAHVLPVAGSHGKFLGDVEVLDSIDRLCKLVDRNETTSSTEEVGDIVDDLQTVLRAAHDQIQESTDVRSLRKVGRLLDSAHMLSINGAAKPPGRPTTRVTR